jgi:hypothetical protein
MGNWQEDLKKAEEEARRAREEVRRLRDETRRIRNEARDEVHRLRDAAREERRNARTAHGSRRSESTGPGYTPRTPRMEMGEGMRSEDTFSMEGVTEVRVDQTAGRVTVRHCAEGETPGAVASGSKSAPQLTVRREGGKLTIEVKLSVGWLFRRKQGATTLVRLTPGIEALKVNLGYGNLLVRDIECRTVKLDVGAGDIQCYSTRGKLEANVGAGKIALYDHHGLASCDTGTGDVLIDVAEIAEGEYRANAGIGRVELRLPPDKQVKLAIESGLGRSRVEYPNGPEDSPTRVSISTGVGEASVRARQPGQARAEPPAPPKQQRAAAAAGRRHEAEELRVLQMLEQGKISSQEAAELIAALQGVRPPGEDDDEDEADS